MRRNVFIFICFFVLFFSINNIFAQGSDSEEKASVAASSPDELWQSSIEELRSNLDMLLNENQQLRQREQSLNNRIAELEGLLKNTTAEKNQLVPATLESVEELGKAKKELEELKKEKMLLGKQLADEDKNKTTEQLKKRISELEHSQLDTNSLKEELANKNSEIGKLEKLVKEYRQEKLQLADKLKQKEAEINSKQVTVSRILKEKEAALKDAENLKKELARLKKGSLSGEEKRVGLLEGELRNLTREKEAMEKDIDDLKKDLAAKFTIIEDLNKEQENLSRDKAILESLLKLKGKGELVSVTLPVSQKPVTKPDVLGYNFAREGKLNEAIEEYKKAILQDENKKDLYYNLAYLYSRGDNLKEAIENYNKVLELDPKDRESLYNLSKIYELLRDEKKSKYYYEAYLKLEGK